MRFRPVVALALLCVPFVMTTAHAEGDYPPPKSGAGHADPARVRPGECTTFSGDGFAPASTLRIADNGDDRGTATSDLQGQFSTRHCFGPGTKPGRHTLTATGPDGSTSGFQAARRQAAVAPTSQRIVSAVVIVEGVSQSSPQPRDTGDVQGGGGLPDAVSLGPDNGAPGQGGGRISFTGLPAVAITLLGLGLVATGALVLLAADRRHRKRRRTRAVPA
jgi:hypothetical protein